MAYLFSVIDRHGAHSWYRQLADLVRDSIDQGVYRPGGELPSEAELARQYGVGRDVVRSALALLRQEGLITSLRGTNAKVREQVARREVMLGAGDELIGRMPTEPERIERLMDYGVPLLAIKRRTGVVELFPGDRVVITGPTL